MDRKGIAIPRWVIWLAVWVGFWALSRSVTIFILKHYDTRALGPWLIADQVIRLLLIGWLVFEIWRYFKRRAT